MKGFFIAKNKGADMPILKIYCDDNSSTHERRCITDFNNFCEKCNITVDDKQWLVEGLEKAVAEQETLKS